MRLLKIFRSELKNRLPNQIHRIWMRLVINSPAGTAENPDMALGSVQSLAANFAFVVASQMQHPDPVIAVQKTRIREDCPNSLAADIFPESKSETARYHPEPDYTRLRTFTRKRRLTSIP